MFVSQLCNGVTPLSWQYICEGIIIICDVYHNESPIVGYIMGTGWEFDPLVYPQVVCVVGCTWLLALITSLLVTGQWQQQWTHFPQVSIHSEEMVKRLYHTATAIAVSSSQVVVVVFGGLDEYIRGHGDRQQPMKAATVVLEFGNYQLLRGTPTHWIDMCVCWYAELQQSGSGEEEWGLTRAADLTSYRNLKEIEKEMRILNAEMTGQWYIVTYNRNNITPLIANENILCSLQ